MRHVCSNKETRGGAQRIAPMAATDSWKPGSSAHAGRTASMATLVAARSTGPWCGRPTRPARPTPAAMIPARTAGGEAPVSST